MIVLDLGIRTYDQGLYFQQVLHEARKKSFIDDVVLLLEHNHVITAGKGSENADLLVSERELAVRGIPLHHVNRGGKITCHYPGQLVAYPIVNISELGWDVYDYVNRLEEVVILTLADFGIRGKRIKQHRGVFIQNNKIASIGIEIRNSVTMHGFSLNVFEDRTLYPLFIPCGISDKGITFMEKHVHSDVKLEMDAVKSTVVNHLRNIFSKATSEVECQTIQDGNSLHSSGGFNELMKVFSEKNRPDILTHDAVSLSAGITQKGRHYQCGDQR